MSLKQIAEITGLSIATISHALNGTRGVSSENKAKVLKAAEEIGYRPNMAAKTLKTNKSRTIALVIPRVEPGKGTNYFYMDIMAGVHVRLNENKYSLIIGTYQESAKEGSIISLDILKNRWVDGLLVVPNSMQENCINQIVKSNVPFVLIDREIKDTPYDFVISNNEKGSFEAIKLMYEKGRRKIAFVGSMLRTSASYERFIGYKKFIAEYSLPENNKLVVLNDELSISNGIKSAEYLLKQGADGIFVSDNTLTLGVFRYLKMNKVRFSEEISLIGYDDYPWMEDVEPSITTVKQHPFEMGYKAADILLSSLQNPSIKERRLFILETKLICRKSH